ncbi:MAG: TlpA disulfide reductase family protein [Terracidiphilus sp.]|nr:TlpA disulfide reductase family protein [Terracidiphilus sp.]
MRFPRCLILLLLLPLVLASACNRGAHPAQTGKPAPDFTISDGTSTVHLASYRGKVVLVNFWATWCGPCVLEMPSLLALHHQLPNVAILAISVDEDASAYSNFIARRRIDLITVRDPEQKAANLFHSDMWPETFVIDRQGVIRRKFVGAQDWTSPEIRQYLQSL